MLPTTTTTYTTRNKNRGGVNVTWKAEVTFVVNRWEVDLWRNGVFYAESVDPDDLESEIMLTGTGRRLAARIANKIRRS